MTHQVPEYYHVVSELLVNIMDDVGYSSEDRDRKVKVAIEFEVFGQIPAYFKNTLERVYILGSRGEGSTGPGLQSDIDLLFPMPSYSVITDPAYNQPGIYIYHMVKDNFTHPGYVKLQIMLAPAGCTPVPIYGQRFGALIALDTSNRSVLSNSICYLNLLRNRLRQTIPGESGTISGPAIHIARNGEEYTRDLVSAVKCSQWPQEGYEWFQRRRLYGWPTPTQIKNAWEYGCFATPVGHPHSHEQHIEWRLSFSIAERDLVRSFEDEVMKVYILLKMIRKTYIEPVVRDAFSSYHCKVCMLWMRERTPRELWSNGNLLYCLILCIRQLYEWATIGFCPDYFIVTNNIYDRNIIGAVRDDFVQILRYLLSSDCSVLLGIKCCYLGQLMINRISGLGMPYILTIPLIGSERDMDYRLIMEGARRCMYALHKHVPLHYTALLYFLERVMFACKHLSYIMQYPLKHVKMVLCTWLGFHIVTVCKDNLCFISSDQVHYLVDLASYFLSLGITSDATSVRLKLCGLGMELGNHDLTEVCLQHISDNWMRCMYSVTMDLKHPVSEFDCNIKLYFEKLFTKRYSTEKLMQTKVSFNVVYMRSEISITPKPLRMEMFRSVGTLPLSRDEELHSWYDWCVVDSLICLHFFQYMNFSRQRKIRHKQAAMDNMIHVIMTEPTICHRDTVFNILGYSFMQENRPINAFLCFTQSLKICPHHNSAKFYLGLLFHKVLVTHRRPVPY